MIITGDAFAVLPALVEQTFAVCVTSPPYWRSTTRGFGGEDYAWAYLNTFERALRMIGDALEENGALWVIVGESVNAPFRDAAARVIQHARNARLSLSDWLVWDSGRNLPHHVLGFGSAAVPRGAPRMWREEPAAVEGYGFETIGPELAAMLVGAGPRGPVLDPFAGVGTVGVAANQLGLPFTGIEIDPMVAFVAKERCA